MDKIEICNMALSRIGASPIETLDEPSEPARKCLQFYEHDRRVVLRRFPWSWATRRVELAQVQTKPQDYQYAFRYPSDCVYLRKLYIFNEEGRLVPFPEFVQYKILSDGEGKVLYTNFERVLAEYTADIRDVSIMDEIFCEALSWKLAASIAFKLTGNAQIAQMATQEYERMVYHAIAEAENEQNVRTPELLTFIRARF